jgi:hypothetical protein
VKSWNRAELGREWQPPSCTGWAENGFNTLVTISARFHPGGGPDELFRRVGAVSKLAGIRYWSTTHKEWRTLVQDANALTDSRHGEKRGDFAATEIKAGAILYFEQVDNLSGKAIFRLRILEANARQFIFEVENVSTVRYSLIPIFPPEQLQSIYYLDRESDDVWCYYGMVRTGKKASGLVARNEFSSINRAVAFYRYFVGIPTEQEPPGAR